MMTPLLILTSWGQSKRNGNDSRPQNTRLSARRRKDLSPGPAQRRVADAGIIGATDWRKAPNEPWQAFRAPLAQRASGTLT
jgi:hypothetical protein